MKEIVDISTDKKLGLTEVHIRAPDFLNFGQRLGELERMASQAALAEPVDIAEIDKLTNHFNQLTKTGMEASQKKMESMPEGAEKEMLKSSLQMLNQAIEEFSSPVDDSSEEAEEEETNDDSGSGETEGDRFQYDLQSLRISLPENMSWDAASERTVDLFLEKWPNLRPKVSEAAFQHYREIYPQLAEIFGGSAGSEFTMPKPTDPVIFSNLFCITTIYLHADGAIGLGGHCTWDEEHGFGVLIRDAEIVAVGHQSEAFS